MFRFFRKSSPHPNVELYSKPDCHLCELAKVTLEEVRRHTPFQLVVTDISQKPDLLEKYHQEIPVIFINGKKSFKFTVDRNQFKKKLLELSNHKKIS